MSTSVVWSPATPPGKYAKALGALLRAHRTARKLTQLDLGDLVGLDHSVISRFESASKLPDSEQLVSLAKELDVNQEDRDELHLLHQRAVLERDSPTPGTVVPSSAIPNLIGGLVETVRLLRINGHSVQATSQAHAQSEWLAGILPSFALSPLEGLLLDFGSELLMEEAKSLMDHQPKDEVWNVMTPIITRQLGLYQQSHEPAHLMMAELMRESALYVAGKQYDAHALGASLLASRAVLSDRWQLELERAVAINAGAAGDSVRLEEAATAIERRLDAGVWPDPQTPAFLLDGLARGEALLGLDRAFATLKRARTAATGHHEPQSQLRELQLARTELRLMVQFHQDDGHDFQTHVDQALDLAVRLNNTRYYDEIVGLRHRDN